MDDLHRQLAEALEEFYAFSIGSVFDAKGTYSMRKGEELNAIKQKHRAILSAYNKQIAAAQVSESESHGAVAGSDSSDVTAIESVPSAVFSPASAATHVSVPVEPTDRMCVNGAHIIKKRVEAGESYLDLTIACEVYKAMLAAARREGK